MISLNGMELQKKGDPSRDRKRPIQLETRKLKLIKRGEHLRPAKTILIIA